MGSVYKRGRTWWLKYKDATGEWTPEATKAVTKAEARAPDSVLTASCGFRPCRSAIPADADHPFRQGDDPGA